MRKAGLIALAALGLASAAALPAASAPAAKPVSHRHPVVLPGTEERTFFLAGEKRPFRVFISRPEGKAPKGGFPVIYILDGNSIFGTIRDEVRRETADTYEAPAVIVAIGYPGDAPWDDARREHDLTPKLPAGIEPYGPAGSIIPDTGGAEPFLRFIRDTIKPAIERDYPVDRARQTLAGHSLGGLFTLYAAFTQPDLFQTYVAMSPSIWYGDRYILKIEQETRARRIASGVHARMLLTIGGCEQTPGECDPGVPGSARKNKWLTEDGRMVDDVKNLQAALTQGGGGFAASAHVFDDEHHESVIGGSVARLVRFALSPAEQSPPEQNKAPR
ncbi:MAG: alpha/beta hydrolase-fold protein [Caulobacteraceae bacterium]|nr:alpha/beta hydrolase-fold protein [Caulobacteraceae bacterium]